MSNITYLAEQEIIKEEVHLHHWIPNYFFNMFAGLYCKKCDTFVASSNMASYVNYLERKLKNAN